MLLRKAENPLCKEIDRFNLYSNRFIRICRGGKSDTFKTNYH